jgi:hypothetical protein
MTEIDIRSILLYRLQNEDNASIIFLSADLLADS